MGADVHGWESHGLSRFSPVGSVTEKEEEASERVSGLRSVDLNTFDLHTSDVQHV